MDNPYLAAAAAFFLGFFAGICILLIVLVKKSRDSARRDGQTAELASRNSFLTEELKTKNDALETLRARLLHQAEENAVYKTALERERTGLQEKIDFIREMRDGSLVQFKNLANEIFERKGEVFVKQNRANLDGILQPLREKLAEFSAQIRETHETQVRDKVSLQEHIKTLTELNRKMSEETENLTKALKGESKMRGAWGEMILAKVLEQSGLRKDHEYRLQVSLKDADDNRYQPDAVVNLPGGRDVIIDSKVSLVAYDRFCAAESDDRRDIFRLQHVQSVRNHIRELGKKIYHALDGVNSLDFVLMFIPMEGAFALALQSDDRIFSDAFDRKIILVSPTTLFATLRAIGNSWRTEYQNRNAGEIALQAGKLYDKFILFVEDMKLIGERIEQARDAHEKASGKLFSGRGNLVKRAQDLTTMGAVTTREMDPSLAAGGDE